MAFNRGGQAAEQAAKDAQKTFSRVEFFKLDDGGTTTLRLLDDSPDWIWTKQHSFVPTKGAPADAKGSWPGSMSATCRKDECIGSDTCYICDHMVDDKDKPRSPSLRLWARAVVREEVRGTKEMVDEGVIPASKLNKVVGHMDAEHDVEETDREGKATGNKIRQKKMILINMGMKNFFSGLQGYHDANGTVLDRDFRITRKGKGLDSEYRIISCDPYPDHDLFEDKDLREKYEVHAAKQSLSVDDVEKSILERGSDEYYAKFFDEGRQAPRSKARTKDADEGPAGESAISDDEGTSSEPAVSQERLAAMRERIREGGKKSDA